MKHKFNLLIPFIGIVFGLLLMGMNPGELLAGESAIKFEGTRSNHEGLAFWNSAGSGNEAAAIGHAIPFEMGSQPYYMATADFDNIDPSAVAGMSAKSIVSGFSQFQQKLGELRFSLDDLTMKWDVYSLGNDVNGRDWWINGTIETRIYHSEGYLRIQIKGEDLVGAQAPDLYVFFEWNSRQYVILSPAFTLENISASSPANVQELAATLISELDGKRVLIEKPLEPLPNSICIPSGNGRCGGIYSTGDVFLKIRGDDEVRSAEVFRPVESNSSEKLEIFPNPFNPTATIEFSLKKGSFVSLRVYDILGRKVATVIEQPLPAGVHKYDWNATNKASGVYIFKLEIDEKTIIQRAQLLK
jgi:hypothetical protein